MLSNKPYLIRAFYDWIIDSREVPILTVNANHPGCQIPEQHVENGEIVLNISQDAVRDLMIRHDKVEFRASFSGVVYHIVIPVKAVLSIFAEENKQGMYFDYEDEDFFDEGEGSGSLESSFTQEPTKPKRHLRLLEQE